MCRDDGLSIKAFPAELQGTAPNPKRLRSRFGLTLRRQSHPGTSGVHTSARRTRHDAEYLKHGIELMFVGDVISGEALARTSEFNRLTADAIDARHGAGYAKRVSEKVERDVEARFR